jgi:serine/threonine protein kinase
VFDVVEEQGQLWLIMQFIPSITLAAVLQEVGPLQPDEAAKLGAQVASALAAAHAVGIVHRDVKPGNVLIADDGTALISDFGIAHALGDATLTSSGMIHGTPAYLAPEVARGSEANFASDVFSLGATLYSSMEGAPPFGTSENSIALLHRVASGQFPPPQRCGPLTPLILDMLSADPEARPSMRAVADNLARQAAHSRSSAGDPAVTLGASEEATGDEEVDQEPTSDPSLAKTGPSTGSAQDSPVAATSGPDALTVPAPHNGDQRSTEPRRNRGVAAAMAVVVLLGIGILLIAVLLGDRRTSDPAAVPRQSSSAAPASTQPSPASQSPTPSASTPSAAAPKASSSPRQDSSLPASPRTKARTPARAPSPTTAPTVSGAPTAAQLRQAITSYYALMPRNTDAAWPRMTASYQTNHAGGRQAYQRFWDAVDRISVTDVRGTPPSSAQATLTYYFKDGRVVRERTAYGLVNDGGRLKISRTTVLSSVTL